VNRTARRPARVFLTVALLALTAFFAALGVWQVERRAWKHVLIAAVDSRIRAQPGGPPGPEGWATLSADRDAYRRIRLSGRFVPHGETLVRAVSDAGAGYWVLTPLDTGRFVVLINRGFVPPGRRMSPGAAAVGPVEVTGLLRLSEPGGGFLRRNDPAAGDWYSRDVAAIARAKHLDRAAPYFVDADAAHNTSGAPVGGLTVVRFADSHAAYALTWFALAMLSAGAAWYVAGRPGRAATSRYADRIRAGA
jgi:surfeit locus 1 family protein